MPVSEIDLKILHVENGFKHSYGIPPYIDVSPSTIVRNLAAGIISLQEKLPALNMTCGRYGPASTWPMESPRAPPALGLPDFPR
ncbi:hypothetical protein [Caballeronia sordidicola]|uniref:Uncharacterized protein n=1 Tax=Caballeronia sordidicola TaxID=196367 RepID=A0A242N440_CABSO|nr:hypothetical protein [Caballeronia sordidicola]OTP78445.1 hypothetical protein PAMC26577_04600 [Caballeronia sordidicola]